MKSQRDIIIDIVLRAGALLRSEQAKDFSISSKNGDPRDILTSVDITLDTFLKEELLKQFPGETIYSEESKDTILNTKRFWTIDPIDGTSNFSRGIPHFAICIGLVEDGESKCGAMLNPITNELFSFEKGKGAFYNGKKVSVSAIRTLKEATVIFHAGRDKALNEWGGESYKKFLAGAKKTINLSSSALDNAFVGAGRVEACIYGRITSFDISCAIGFVLEAGGVVVGEDWKPLVMSFKPQKVFTANSHELIKELKTIL